MQKEAMTLVRLEEVLRSPETNPDTWLYLPPNPSTWTGTTEGVFSLDSFDFPPESEDYLPEQVTTEGWIETLDAAMIEDVVMNAKDQIENPTDEQLLQAFIFYYKNDGFIEF